MNFKIYYVVILICLNNAGNAICESNYLLDRFEFAESMKIIKSLEIKNCIIVWSLVKENSFGNLKSFSKEGIMTTAMSREILIEYFGIGIFPNVNTMIILKEINLLKIVGMFKSFSRILMEAYRFTWLVFVKYFDLGESEKLDIAYNCRFMITYPVKENQFKVIEIYKVKNQAFFYEFENFDDNEMNFFNNFLYFKRMNLNCSEIVMNFDDDWEEKRQDIMSNRQIEILHDIARIMNFHYTEEKIQPDDYQNLDISGDLYNNPFPFHAYFFTSDFLGPMFKTTVNWYIKYPDIENQGDYIEPFDGQLWFCIIIFIIFNSFLLVVIKKICSEKLSTVEVAFTGWDSLCYQNGSRELNKNYFRIVIFTLRFTAMLIIPAYNAIIISYLAIREPEIPFKNVEEFSEDGSYTMTLPDQSFTEFYFKDSHDHLLQHVYQNLSLKYDVSMIKEIKGRFCSEDLAMTDLDSNIYTIGLRCGILQIETPLTFTFVGIVLKKRSEFKDVFTYNLIRFYSSGIQRKLQKKTEEIYETNQIDNTLDPVEMKQIDDVMIVLGIGFILGGILFLFEIIYYKLTTAKNNLNHFGYKKKFRIIASTLKFGGKGSPPELKRTNSRTQN